MAYPYRRRAPLRRRRVITRRKRMMRRMRPSRSLVSRQPIHNFKRTWLDASTFYLGAAEMKGGYSFKLSDLPGYTEFTSLFDQYRIRKVKIVLVPNFGPNTVPSGGAFLSNFSVNTVLDYNDVTAPANLNELLEYQNMRRTKGTREHKRYFTPAVAFSESTVGATTAIDSKFSPWLSTSQAGTLHFGLKYYAGAIGATTDTLRYQAYITYYIQCKNVK